MSSTVAFRDREPAMITDRVRQKAQFAASLQRNDNVRQAMREAGIASPATAYRWLAQMRKHGDGWIHLPPDRPNAIGADVADAVIALAEANPHWGKARIAAELGRMAGESAISPNGVRGVLLDAGLWTVPDRSRSDASPVILDAGATLDAVQRGIALDMAGQPQAAANLLEPAIWSGIVATPDLMHQLLREPELGSWLQRGLLQLGHALIDTGRWRSAAIRLRWLDQWFADDVSVPSREQQAFQDQGPWFYDRSSGRWWQARWDEFAGQPQVVRVSLRQADNWLETQQYLALFSRETPGEESLVRLSSAMRAIRTGSPRPISDELRDHYVGVIGHDLAVAQLHARWPHGPIIDLLAQAHERFEASGNTGMSASALTYTASAHLQAMQRSSSRSSKQANLVIDHAERAIARVEGETTGVLRSNVIFDAEQILLSVQPATGADRDRLDWLARQSIMLGMGRMARLLLADPLTRPLIADHAGDLQRMA